MKSRVYENLVFEGGGVKGAAYAGALQVIGERKLYQNVKRVAGTSAGSITAGLLAVGAGPEGLMESILKADFEKFISGCGWVFGDIYRLLMRYGIYSGDGFTKILKSYVSKYSKQSPDLTFAQLEQLVYQNPKKFKHLSVITSNITTKQIHVFNSKNTPNIPIWKAIRCSMSIPMVFEPYKIDNNYFMDGGLAWNYPIEIYDKKEGDEDIPNPKTLGFYLESPDDSGFKPPKSKINSLESAGMAMLDFLNSNANSKFIQASDKNRTVFIDDLGVRTTDFDISLKDKKRLIKQGRIATELFLDSN
jgi:NTE family protein